MARDQVSLRLDLVKGEKGDGSPITRAKTFSNINQAIQDAQLLEGAKALGTLLEPQVAAYKKVEVTNLDPADLA